MSLCDQTISLIVSVKELSLKGLFMYFTMQSCVFHTICDDNKGMCITLWLCGDFLAHKVSDLVLNRQCGLVLLVLELSPEVTVSAFNNFFFSLVGLIVR